MIQYVLRHGAAVVVVMVTILLFGVLAVSRVPVQLIPDIAPRIITVETRWPGATPQDVEQDILIEQEEFLRNIAGLRRMTSSAFMGSASIELEFPFGVDLNEAMIRVSNALSQVPGYPENVDEPSILTSSSSEEPFLYFQVRPLEGNPKRVDMDMQRDFIDRDVRSVMERVEGVSRVQILSGAERQVQIIADTQRLAERGVSLAELREAIRRRNIDVSAGDIDSGKRRYLVRVVGRYATLEDLDDMIVVQRGDAVTRLRDVARVRLGHYEIRSRSSTNGDPNILLGVVRMPGSNVIAIRDRLAPVVERINEERLARVGMRLDLVSDDVRYVEESIRNVLQNLLLGFGLSAAVLFVFLRSFSATLIGVIGMPVCVVGAFIGLLLTDRTLNVISMAGIAFAIGMTVDNTIVVLESIYRERCSGKSRFHAAVDGVKSVSTAVISGTVTTIIVFVPLLFIQEEAGQLFSDIGIAISFSILASMVTALLLVPVASLRLGAPEGAGSDGPPPGRSRTREGVLMRAIGWITGSAWRRLGCIILTCGLSVAGIAFLLPPLEYLPEGEESRVFSSVIAPPGYSLGRMEAVAAEIESTLGPLLADDASSDPERMPPLSRFIMLVNPEGLLIVCDPRRSQDIERYIRMIDSLVGSYPGMRVFSARGSIISNDDGGTRAVSIDISGDDVAEIFSVARTIYDLARQQFDDPQIDSAPQSLVLAQPMIEIRPRWARLSELGLSADELGYAVAAQSDGAYVGDMFLEDGKIDLYLYSEAVNEQTIERVPDFTVRTSRGALPLHALADIHESVDSAEIRRVDGRRTVTLYVIPPRSVPLETAVDTVRRGVIDRLRESGELPGGVAVSISGASDQLEATRSSLAASMWVAAALCYLQLVIIYRHWGRPLIILTTVPLGISGGIIGLWALNALGGALPAIGLPPVHQPFDVITMLGFLILVGMAVNNPILIVDKAVTNRRRGMSAMDAVTDAVAQRIRPVLMTTATTVFGISPIVFLPGSGTELYRGVGATILFGLAFTSVVTLTFLPALLITLDHARARITPAARRILRGVWSGRTRQS